MPSHALALVSPHLPLIHAVLCTLALGAVSARAAAPVGIFEDHGDLGAVGIPGSATYNSDTQEYALSASGANMWGDNDEGQFAWRKVRGDFILQATAAFLGEGGNPHRKIGLIVRASLDPKSALVNACRHGNGVPAIQFRKATGAVTEEIHLDVRGPEVLQLERSGGKFRMSAANFGEMLVSQDLEGVALPDEVYVGIYVCAHDNAVVQKATFHNVRLIRPAKPDFKPYHDYIGSDIELMDSVTGVRRTVCRAEDSLQAPNWTPDGKRLIYNHNGRMFSFDLQAGTSTPIDTGAQVHCNNDHALSFDGTMLAISSGSPSIVFTLPVGGGTPFQVTPIGPSYFHCWSPDGKSLLFTGQRSGEWDIYRVPAAGGPEARLTSGTGLNDGSEYAPDGKTIFFISDRTGRMQIWKMDPDGSGQTQMTFDDQNNWFPHVSPDGRTLFFISYSPEVPANEHPFYKHVYLRRMPAAGGTPKVVAYLYGGQGSINVNSWSPDNRMVAFVSNSGSF